LNTGYESGFIHIHIQETSSCKDHTVKIVTIIWKFKTQLQRLLKNQFSVNDNQAKLHVTKFKNLYYQGEI